MASDRCYRVGGVWIPGCLARVHDVRDCSCPLEPQERDELRADIARLEGDYADACNDNARLIRIAFGHREAIARLEGELREAAAGANPFSKTFLDMRAERDEWKAKYEAEALCHSQNLAQLLDTPAAKDTPDAK